MAKHKPTRQELVPMILLARRITQSIRLMLGFLEVFNDTSGELTEWFEIKRRPAKAATRGFFLNPTKRYRSLLAALNAWQINEGSVRWTRSAVRPNQVSQCEVHGAGVKRPVVKRKSAGVVERRGK